MKQHAVQNLHLSFFLTEKQTNLNKKMGDVFLQMQNYLVYIKQIIAKWCNVAQCNQ